MNLRKKLLFALFLWVFLDLSGGAVVAWKITRTEAWVRTKDPVTHHGFRPLESQLEQYGPLRRMIYINSLGGKDISCREVAKVGDSPRVAVFGDSFAEGWGLSYEESLPGHVQDEMGTQGIEVMGFGVVSYCPSLTAKWMKKLRVSDGTWRLC